MITRHEATLPAPALTLPAPAPAELPITVQRQIPQGWTDYNGHMNEAHFSEVASQATDRFMELIGCDAAYIAQGGSFFTAENHVRFLAEMHAGDTLTATTQVLAGEGKKMHLFHRIHASDGTLTATIETFLLHINLTTRKTSLPAPEIAERLKSYATQHAALPRPEGAGRHVAQR